MKKPLPPDVRNRITREALQKAFDDLPEVARANAVTASFAVACGVLKAFLGAPWFDKHIMPEGKRGFLTIDESTVVKHEETSFRIIDLAEVLYNLQTVNGFDECVTRLRNGDIEGTYAELDFGRMLYLHKIRFRYVTPQGTKTRDYDLEVLYPDGRIACGDAKCKIESTDFGAKTVTNTLDDARKQLPADRPSIVFVKLPPRWMKIRDYDKVLLEVARKFLQGTQRVVSVKYYVSPLSLADGYMKHQHAYKEISNLRTAFGDGLDWNIFRHIAMPPEWNGMPPWWQRILFYPDGKQHR